MNTVTDALVYSLETSKMMLNRFTEDLNPKEYLHRPCPKANCAAWTIGHLILTERAFGKHVAATYPALPDGFDHRFSRDEGAPQAAEFGDVAILRPLFNSHREATIAAVKTTPPPRFAEPIQTTRAPFKTVGETMEFLCLHEIMHVGQLTIIRRSLGRPPLI
jgi:hypothetical protein